MAKIKRIGNYSIQFPNAEQISCTVCRGHGVQTYWSGQRYDFAGVCPVCHYSVRFQDEKPKLYTKKEYEEFIDVLFERKQ